MTRQKIELARPYGRDDVELVRGAKRGTYWQAADGLVVQLAAGEVERNELEVGIATHRELLALAIDEAKGQR